MTTPSFTRLRTMLVGGLLLAFCQQMQASEASDLSALHDSVRQWIELRKQDEKLKTDWKWQKNVLENTKHALEAQIENNTTQLEQFKTEHSEQIAELKSLESESRDLTQVLDLTEQQISEQIRRFISLRKRLPPRLEKSLELSFASLADDKMPLNDRFQILVTALGRVSQFNHLITYSEEMVLTEGQPHLMAVLYWGLSRAYAMDLATEQTYIGSAKAETWNWQLSKEVGGRMKELISIFREEIDPVYVNLPVTIE